jgi:hypothetical protein
MEKMMCAEAKQLDLVDYLASLGHQPAEDHADQDGHYEKVNAGFERHSKVFLRQAGERGTVTDLIYEFRIFALYG